MKKLFLFFCLTYFVNDLKGAVFTVTSNSNTGPGTLREAIEFANANGIAQTDYIFFNIQGNSITDFTIALESELPILTSNITIDATTQPAVPVIFPNPNIRIYLARVVAIYFSGLRLDNAKSIEIYGLSFSNFKSDPLGVVDEKKAGIFLLNTSDVIIGAPGKPNCFNNNYAGILSPYIIPRTDVVNVKISSNILGMGESGLNAQPNETGIDLSFLKNSVIGGDTPEEGNLITSNTLKGIAVAAAEGNIKITNNLIGVDKTLAKTIASASAIGIYVNGQFSVPVLTNNIICSQKIGLEVDFVNGGFVVSGNKIGTGPLGTENFGNETGIHVNFCNKGIIGGNTITEGNNIAYNKTGVLIEIAYPISMLKNSFYCNSTAAVTFKSIPEGKIITQSRIRTITTTNVSGNYLPNSKVELFYTDSCPDCQGKTWFATLPTDANGNWTYNGPVTGKVTSMGTNSDGATSTFSKPSINNASAAITGVVCGETTGSIAVDVYDASVFEWYNSANQLVSDKRVLTGVGNGTYYLKAGQLGACDVTSAKFTIDASSNGLNDSQKVIIDAYCNKSNGSISKITVANNLTRIWYNLLNQEMGRSDDLMNVPAGSYYFTAGKGNCLITSPTYVVKNVNEVYQLKSSNVTLATCGSSNGRVDISGEASIASFSFKWFDEQNIEVSNSEDLINVAPGRYRVVAYSANGCSNEVGQFTVPEAKPPVINTDAMQRFLSCDGKIISTTGLSIVGSTSPYTIKWTDEDGTIV
ncbi:MAG: hypothetical protein EOO42_07600, partial [Flavobacteriales bacterium]